MSSRIARAAAAAALSLGLALGAVGLSAEPAHAGGKVLTKWMTIRGYNAFANCSVGTNASAQTLRRVGYTVLSGTCTKASNGTWTGNVVYR